MHVESLCNGFVNPLSVDYNEINISVKTRLSEKILTYIYRFYDSYENYSGKNSFLVRESSKNNEKFDFSLKKDVKRIYYDVKIVTEGKEYQSDVGFFESQLIDGKIIGEWIENPNFDGCVAEFVRDFVIERDFAYAKLYICGLGAYSSKINGIATDEFYYKPVLTDYEKRKNLNNEDYDEKIFSASPKKVLYDTFDVSKLLKKGNNVLSVLLGTGYYCDTDKNITDPSFRFDKPKLFFELHIFYKNEKEIIKSDTSVKVRNTGRISQLFSGDRFDFTKEKEVFYYAHISKKGNNCLLPNYTFNDKIEKTIEPIELTSTKKNIRLFDFGVNHSGSIHAVVKGKKGRKLLIRYYETLKSNEPNPYTSRWIAYKNPEGKPIDYIDQQDEYVLDGEENEILPLFHWNCYRYVEIIGEEIEIIKLESFFIHTELNQDGFFDCSNEFFNKLYQAAVLTQKDNMHCGVVSDCPHREKLPYTGDGLLVMPSIYYTFDAKAFYRKWFDDIIESQASNGWLPYSAPYLGGSGGYWWSNALAYVADRLYSFTCEYYFIDKAFKPIEKYLSFCKSQLDENGVIKTSCVRWLLGEWLAPYPVEANTEYINTVAYLFAVQIAKKFSVILHKDKKIKIYEELEKEIKQTLVNNFFDKTNLNFCKGVQGENVLALVFGFVPEEYKVALHNKVVEFYKKEGHFDTGIIATPFLLDYLTDNNEEDLAYTLMTARGYPSFSNMLEGETTFREFWGKTWLDFKRQDKRIEEDGEISHCHPMFTSIIPWLYKNVAGLNVDNLGKKEIIFSPKYLEKVCSAKAKKSTDFGDAEIEYTKNENEYEVKIIVPHGISGKFDFNKYKILSAKKDGIEISDFDDEKNYCGGNYIFKLGEKDETLC